MADGKFSINVGGNPLSSGLQEEQTAEPRFASTMKQEFVLASVLLNICFQAGIWFFGVINGGKDVTAGFLRSKNSPQAKGFLSLMTRQFKSEGFARLNTVRSSWTVTRLLPQLKRLPGSLHMAKVTNVD